MQPQPPETRQSGPQAKPAPRKGTLHDLKPGGPIKPKAQGYVNPGPTDNLRGVEPNTAMHRGTPNPHQHGQIGHIGGADHDPGKNDDVHGHGIDPPIQGNPHVAKHMSKPIAPKPPDPKGVRK